MRTRQTYVFLHRVNGRYYWRRIIPGTALEEVVSCDVAWFWGPR